MNRSRVVVTGASGYIGSRLCHALKLAGFHVIGIARKPAKGSWDEFYCIDLADGNLNQNYFQNVETVYHLAGRAHAVDDLSEGEDLYRVAHVEVTKHLLESSRDAGIKNFLYFSSVKAMNEGGDIQHDETSECNPETNYGKTKLEAEGLVLHGNYVQIPVVVRLPLVYGNKPKGNLSRMIQAIRASRFPPIPELHNKRSMVHVEDVVRAAILVVAKKPARQVFIVTDGNDYSTRQIYDLIRKALSMPEISWNFPFWLLVVFAKAGDAIEQLISKKMPFDTASLQKLVESASYSSEKLQGELGFKPQIDLPSSIENIVSSIYS